MDNGVGIICYRGMSWSRNFLNYFVLRKLFFSSRSFSLSHLTLNVSRSFFRFLPSLSPSLIVSSRRFHSLLVSPIQVRERGKNTGIVEHVWNAHGYFSDHYFRPFLPPLPPPPLLPTVSSSTPRQVPSYIFKKDGFSSNALHS